MAQRVGRGIDLLFHDSGTRRWWVVSSTPRPHFIPGKHPVPILQETRLAQGPVWKGGKSHPHRDSIPDRPEQALVQFYKTRQISYLAQFDMLRTLLHTVATCTEVNMLCWTFLFLWIWYQLFITSAVILRIKILVQRNELNYLYTLMNLHLISVTYRQVNINIVWAKSLVLLFIWFGFWTNLSVSSRNFVELSSKFEV